MQEDQISNGAAALAFYMVLALFPSTIFGLSILAYLPVEHLTEAIMDLIHEVLPASAADLLTDTVASVVSRRSGKLVSFGFLFAIWSATTGMVAVMQQLNVVYEVKEERTFLRSRAVALGLSVAFFVLMVGALMLVVFGGVLQSFLADHLGWSSGLRATFAVLRWVIIVAALHLALSLMYRWGPNLEQKCLLVSPGSAVATVALLLASIAFKIYVSRFANYDALYGSLGAVIVLLSWLFVAGWTILFGAEIDDVFRRQRAAAGVPSRDCSQPGAPCPPP